MTGDNKNKASAKGSGEQDKKREPEWAAGLKRLYDSVVEESLPDPIKDLLSKLDAGKQ